ncbi:uncharacterized protein METZ01_LOCUS120901 [marine metagenome]|uniref:Uncharacterized protein n=1 Tax=marine metagenome TaxID=408172 RepID=A0A381XV23_9ZZZZ
MDFVELQPDFLIRMLPAKSDVAA